MSIDKDPNINDNNIDNYYPDDYKKKISIYETYIYDYMVKLPIFENYNIFNIYKLNEIANSDNNNLKYEFSYKVSQILISHQNDLNYRNKQSILINIIHTLNKDFGFSKNIITEDYYNKSHNLNTNNLKYFLSSVEKNNDTKKYLIRLNNNNNYTILNVGFLDIITTNSNKPELNYNLIKDVYLGFKYFNKLKEFFPTFGYVYCYMKCTKIDDNYNNDIKNWCNKTEDKNNLVPYVITDNYYNNNNDNNESNNNIILLQFISIINYINIEILNKIKNENDKKLISNFIIKNIYSIYNDKGYNIPIYNNNKKIGYLNTNYILYIPIISNYIEGYNFDINTNISKIEYFKHLNSVKFPISIKDILNILKIEYPNISILFLYNLYNNTNNEILNNQNNNLLNNYYYNLPHENNNILKNKKSIFNIFFNKNNNIDNDKLIDIKLTKFVSEYCLNDLKYMNKKKYNYVEKKELEKSFNVLIDKKIEKLNNYLNDDNYNIIKIYNKYVKFIDILVKAQCLDYKVKLYNIFKFKMNLAEKILTSGMENSEKDNMIYTIEKSYKDLPNSNFFLNFISKTSLIDIIINAFIYYLYIYCILFLYSFINKNNMFFIGKSILKNYITNENIDSVKKSLEYGAKIAYELFNNYGGNVIVAWYRKIYQKFFIYIPRIFGRVRHLMIPLVLNTLITLNGLIKFQFNMINYIIDAINRKLFGNTFLRFKIYNLLSYDFPSMIYFMWSEMVNNSDNTLSP